MIEVIATLIVIGIITAVALSRTFFSGNELFTETDLLKTNLRFAQVKALTNNADNNTNWGISFAGNSYTLLRNGVAANVSFPSDQAGTHNLSSGVTITAPANVTYDIWGSPGGANIPITLNMGGEATTFTITQNTGHIP